VASLILGLALVPAYLLARRAMGVGVAGKTVFYTKQGLCATRANVKGDRVGEFEELTVLAVRALGEPTYAVPVQRFIERKAGRAVSMGAVYAALGRLETKGLLRSTIGEATPRRGGKGKARVNGCTK